jgi:hypothetical protein
MATTIITIVQTNIDVEKLKSELNHDPLVGSIRVIEILPGTEIVMDGVLSGPEITQVETLVTNHVNLKDATQFKVTANLHVDNDMEVDGNNTVLNTVNVTIEDNIILLDKNVTGTPPLIKAGFEIERGTSPNAQMVFDEVDDTFKYTSDFSTYYPLRDSTDPNFVAMARNKIATGIANGILFNNGSGAISESADIKWFADGVSFADNIKLFRASHSSDSFVQFEYVTGNYIGLKLYDATQLNLYAPQSNIYDTLGNLKLNVGALSTSSYQNLGVVKANPVFELEMLSGKGAIQSNVASVVRHQINFNSDDSLEVKALFGDLNLNCATGKLVKLQYSGVDKLTVGTDTRIYTTLLVNSIQSITGDLNLAGTANVVVNCATSNLVKLQYAGVDKLTVGADTRIYTELIVSAVSPLITLTPSGTDSYVSASSGNLNLRAPVGNVLVTSPFIGTWVNINNKLTITSEANASPLIRAWANCQFDNYCQFVNHVDFNTTVDFSDVVSAPYIAGNSGGVNDLYIRNGSPIATSWVFNNNYFRPMDNNVHSIGYDGYSLESLYSKRIHIKSASGAYYWLIVGQDDGKLVIYDGFTATPIMYMDAAANNKLWFRNAGGDLGFIHGVDGATEFHTS